MNSENKELFACDVCERTFAKAGLLSRHKHTTAIHDTVRRNSHNEIVFTCGVCKKDYGSSKSLVSHQRYAKHVHQLPEPKEDVTTTDTTDNEENAIVDEHFYPGDDKRIRKELSHEWNRVIELSTSLVMGNVQEAVKRAFHSVREEMIPLYAAGNMDRVDVRERVCKILTPFEDGLIMTVLRDTFDLANKLKNDLECL